MNIKELAEQAGIDQYDFGYMDITKDELDKFAEFAMAHEREECAKLCVVVPRTGAYFARLIRARSKA